MFCFLCLAPVNGQNNKVIYPHSVFWHKTEASEFINYKWGVGVDFVLRTKNELSEGSMFSKHLRDSYRPWVHYQVSPKARFSISPIGFMNTTEYVGKPEDIGRAGWTELRTTFQYWHHLVSPSGKLMQTWRYRYELRWQTVDGADEARFFTRFRFRYRVRYSFNTDDFYENKTVYAAISNEIGLNMGKNVVLNTFNQNRLYIGVGYRFANVVRAELRYVNRLRTRGSTGFEFDNGQGIMLGLYIDQVSGLLKSDDPTIPRVKFFD